MSDEELRDYVATMLFSRQLTWWQTKSAIGKWSLGNIPPDREDYLIDL